MLEQAEGDGGALFLPWSNVRRDLIAACQRAGIEAVSPNDLRRTYSMWMKAAGRQALANSVGEHSIKGPVTTSKTVANMAAMTDQAAPDPLELVPETGIEPVTRGFSVPCSTN